MLNRLSLAFGDRFRKPQYDPSQFDYDDGEDSDENSALLKQGRPGGATVMQTSINVAKIAMGTGTLALPFAATKGGLLFNVLGLFLISIWNYYSANCLLRCLEYSPQIMQVDVQDEIRASFSVRVIEEEESRRRSMRRSSASVRRSTYASMYESKPTIVRPPPPDGTTTYGTVAWYASGPAGLMVLDLLMLMLFFGLVIAYEVAMASFIKDMPMTTGSRKMDLMIPSTIVAILSCAKDLSFLSKFSGMGLIAVGLSFAVISMQGFFDNGISGFKNSVELNLWPENLSAASSWFGVVVFGYGVVPFVYNIRNSMESPQEIGLSLQIGLFIVLVGYMTISNGVRVLFSPSHEFDGDVLQAMPNTWIALLVRFLMTFVVTVSEPLVIVPFGELLEGKLGMDDDEDASTQKRVVVRLFICIVCTVLSLFLGSGFVNVVSFIGCFCFSMTGFVLPTLFCIQLYRQKQSGMDSVLLFDVAMLLLGITATAYTSVMTFSELISSAEW